MARIETWSCTNCYAEEDAPDTDVDEITGEYLCTDCRAQGRDSREAQARRHQNGGIGFGGAVRSIDALKREWEREDRLKQIRAKRQQIRDGRKKGNKR